MTGHRPLLVLPLVAALLAAACGAPPPRHNILLITLDTTRADHLGVYGAGPAATPALDSLARTGVIFQQARAQAAVTPVAHASLFTGLNPYQHGLRTLHGNRDYHLSDGVETLAEALAGQGYETAAFISAFPCSRRFGLDRGFALFDEEFDAPHGARVGRAGNVSTGLAQRDAARTTTRALEWLAARDRERPFFLWVHYFDPHDPLMRPPPEDVAPFMEGFPEHERMERLLGQDLAAFVEEYARQPDLMRSWLRRLYRAEVAFMDRHVGRLLGELTGTGLGARTVVAVTSDHGEGLGDHGWWGHGILYQEQIHAPLILAGPGLPPGLEIADPVRHVDVAPTLLDLAGARPFRSAPTGISLGPLLAARAAGRAPAAAEVPGPAYADSVTLMRYGAVFSRDVQEVKDDQLYAWIDGSMKWIHHRLRPGESELYDLARDPGERVNLHGARPEVAARLDAALQAERPLTETTDFSLPEDEEVRRRLRSLGYVDPGGS